MEAKNAEAVIPDSEFTGLIRAVQRQQPDAMLQMIALFHDDIEKISRMSGMPQEDAKSQIITELLTFVQSEEGEHLP